MKIFIIYSKIATGNFDNTGCIYAASATAKREPPRREFCEAVYQYRNNYPPKLSYIIDFSSTPKSVSIPTTAFDIGPEPHI